MMVPVSVNLPPFTTKTLFTFSPSALRSGGDPNCLIYPLDYATIRGGYQKRGTVNSESISGVT